MNFLKKVLILFLLVASIQVNAESLNENDLAKKAYESANYKEALEYWLELYRNGNSDPHLFFNIGNAESMLGNIPEAIYFYELALRFKPGNHKIKSAIENERNKIEDSVAAIDTFFLVDWVKTFLSLLRPGGWAYVGFAFFMIALMKWLFQLKIFAFGRFISKGGNWGFGIIGAIFIWIAFLSYRQIYSLHEGILMSTCELMQGPSIQSPHLRTVHPGEKVKVTDGITGWNKVNLLNLDEGWLKEDCFRIVDIRDRNIFPPGNK